MPQPPRRLKDALSGRYALEGEIGRGGMATVYRGRDLRHERDVAIKVLRPELAAVLGPERFLREIRIAAQIQHPHVLQLYDSGEADGFLYYIMPLIEGESVRERLAREGELPVADALRILRFVADALAHAHERGLVHRDIKPDNVMLYGRHAAVTDFGVAKALTSATTTSNLTSAGVALGTPAYMAPEQASGLPDVDHRADIYSFGILAYEMLTGAPPFRGDTPQQVLAKQVTEEPQELTTRRKRVPAAIAGLVMRCLQKRPADRWQSMDEVLYQLEVLATPSGGMTPTSARLSTVPTAASQRRMIVGGAATILVLGVVGAVMVFTGDRPDAVAPPVQRQLTFSGDVVLSAVSPDGQFLAYSGVSDSGVFAFIRDLAGGATTKLLSRWQWLTTMRWAPDSRRVYMSGGDETGAHISAVFSRIGGDPTPVRVLGTRMSWSVDGRQQFMWADDFPGFNIVADNVSLRTEIAIPDTTGWLIDVEQNPTKPDIFAVRKERATGERSVIYRVVVDSARRWSESIDSATWNEPIDDPEIFLSDDAPLHAVRWAPDGKALFYLREEANGLDLWLLEVGADYRAVAEPVLVLSSVDALFTEDVRPSMTLTNDGSTLYLTKGRRVAHLWEVARNPAGEWSARQMTDGTAIHWAPAVSPDGTRLAFVRAEGGRSNVFVMPWGGGTALQITQNDSVFGEVAWSPNGTMVAFGIRRDGRNHVAVAQVHGGPGILVLDSTELSNNGTIEWAPGEHVLYQRPGVQQFHVVTLTGDERPVFPEDTAQLGWPLSIAYSPRADWLAVGWNRRRQQDDGLWVISMADSTYTQIQEGGIPMVVGWSTSGDAVYTVYLERREIWRVPLEGAPSLLASRLPFEPGWIGTTFADTMVLEQSQTIGDVWAIENYDPRGARR